MAPAEFCIDMEHQFQSRSPADFCNEMEQFQTTAPALGTNSMIYFGQAGTE